MGIQGHRVEIDLFQQTGRHEFGNRDQNIGQGFAVAGSRTPISGQEPVALQLLHEMKGIVAGQGGKGKGNILEELNKNPAKAKHDHRAELGVNDAADDDLRARLRLLFKDHPCHILDLHQVVAGRRCRGSILQTETDPAHVGFGADFRRKHLCHKGVAKAGEIRKRCTHREIETARCGKSRFAEEIFQCLLRKNPGSRMFLEEMTQFIPSIHAGLPGCPEARQAPRIARSGER